MSKKKRRKAKRAKKPVNMLAVFNKLDAAWDMAMRPARGRYAPVRKGKKTGGQS
jgi:hypothetical protein